MDGSSLGLSQGLSQALAGALTWRWGLDLDLYLGLSLGLCLSLLLAQGQRHLLKRGRSRINVCFFCDHVVLGGGWMGSVTYAWETAATSAIDGPVVSLTHFYAYILIYIYMSTIYIHIYTYFMHHQGIA